MPKEMQSNANAAEPSAPSSLTRHQEVANRVLDAIVAAKAELTPLDPPSAAAVPFNRANGSVSIDFMIGVVALVQKTPSLQGLTVTLDVDAAQETLDYIQAYVPLLNELEAFRRALQFSVGSRKAVLGSQALRAYQAIKGLSRDEKLALQPHTAILKRALGRGPKRTRTPQNAPQPQPQPPMPPLETGKEVPKP